MDSWTPLNVLVPIFEQPRDFISTLYDSEVLFISYNFNTLILKLVIYTVSAYIYGCVGLFLKLDLHYNSFYIVLNLIGK